MGEVLLGTVVLGVILAWSVAIAHLRGGQPLLPFEPRREAPWGLLDVTLGLLLLITFQSISVSQLGSPTERNLTVNEARSALVGLMAASLAAVAASMLLIRLRTRADGRDLGIAPSRVWSDVFVGGFAFLLLGPIVFAMQAVLVAIFKYESHHPLLELLRRNPESGLFLLVAAMAVVVAPVAEEYFFRVLLQGWLEKTARRVSRREWPVESEPYPPSDVLSATGPASDEEGGRTECEPRDARERLLLNLAIGISAALFALMHAEHGPDPIPLFVLAVGLGYLYQRTHRLLPCVILHMGLNATTMAMVWVGLRQE